MGMLIHRHNEHKPDPNMTTTENLNPYEPEEIITEQEQDERPRRGRPPRNDDM